jgi:hypothetical protein
VKRFIWVLLLLLTAPPVWAANKKLTVQQLKDLLVSLQQAKKTDEEVADKLQEVDLGEELTRNAMGALSGLVPGQLSGERIEILQGLSAVLAPPSTELPSAPAPDVAAQKAILSRATDYATNTYMQNPHFSVIKSTLRFQDESKRSSDSGVHTFNLLNAPMKLIDKRQDPVETDKGIEKPAASRAKTKWGLNGLISEGEPGPNLGAVLADAAQDGKFDWLRWQTIDGKQIAVFAFVVGKKKSHFDVSYCCFPKTDIQDVNFGGLTPGGIQSVSSFVPFKKVVGYHGELFIDPDTGTILRIITHADLKPADFVFREEMRIDYGPVVVNGKEYVLPRSSFTITEENPNADNASAVCTVRHTLFHVAYQNYSLAQAR